MPLGSGKTRVLIVDDSALIRQLLTELLSSDPDIEVVGSAADPLIAREKIKALNPDVITLDIEMPKMDGITFLERIMALRPMPVVIFSTLTQKGTEAALRALEAGAVEVIPKPRLGIENGVTELAAELRAKVKAAARTSVAGRRSPPVAKAAPLTFDHKLSNEGRIVAIGASTGGVEAIHAVLTGMPANVPAMLITQHMPAGFTASFAKRLNDKCAMSVQEAVDGDRVLPGHVYIAPGNQHLELTRSGAQYFCRLTDHALVSGHRPSVDVLFSSVASAANTNAVGVILTGMGRDGADGLLKLRRAGGRTLGQNEQSALVYGMPRAAMQCGAVEREVTLSSMAEEILALS